MTHRKTKIEITEHTNQSKENKYSFISHEHQHLAINPIKNPKNGNEKRKQIKTNTISKLSTIENQIQSFIYS